MPGARYFLLVAAVAFHQPHLLPGRVRAPAEPVAPLGRPVAVRSGFVTPGAESPNAQAPVAVAAGFGAVALGALRSRRPQMRAGRSAPLKRRKLLHGTVSAVLCALFGAAPSRAAPLRSRTAGSSELPAEHLSLLYDTRAQSFLTAEPQRHLRSALVRSLASSGGAQTPRVFFAGEVHTHSLHHAKQLELIKAVNELDDGPLTIGLEMFYRQQQRLLDDFVFGNGSFEELAERTNWRSTWGYDLNHYAKIFSFARKNQIRLVGLNCPYPLVNLVGRVGVEGVPAELQPYLPEMDLSNGAHYERFTAQLGEAGHLNSSMPPEKLQRMYEAQTLWDEYMADSIAKHMGSGGQPAAAQKAPTESTPSRMVVLVGSGHIRGHVGLPDRVTRRTGMATFSMVPFSVEWTAERQPSIERPFDSSEAEWLLYTQPEVETWPVKV